MSWFFGGWSWVDSLAKSLFEFEGFGAVFDLNIRQVDIGLCLIFHEGGVTYNYSQLVYNA